MGRGGEMKVGIVGGHSLSQHSGVQTGHQAGTQPGTQERPQTGPQLGPQSGPQLGPQPGPRIGLHPGPRIGPHPRPQKRPQQPQSNGYFSKSGFIALLSLIVVLIAYLQHGQDQIRDLESKIDHLSLKLDTFKDEILTSKMDEIKNGPSKYSKL